MTRSTIVRYRADLPPENAYPRRIVSPPTGGPCCLLHSRQIGKVRREGSWRYVYVRCDVCGYTVRRILGRTGPWRLTTGKKPEDWRRFMGRRRRPGFSTRRKP